MDSEDPDCRWKQFLDVATMGTSEGGMRLHKKALCKMALIISEELMENGCINEDRYDIWSKHFGEVCAVLDNDLRIQKTVREYFLALHSGKVGDFSIEFRDKFRGRSDGNVCDVNFSGKQRRFYVKCHQRGSQSTYNPIATRCNTVDPPFIQELFIYKLLSLIAVGGDVHFPFPITFESKTALFIATEEMNFTVASELEVESVEVETMVLIHFIQCILRLDDVGKNEENYGQSIEGKPVIVDFRFDPRDDHRLSQAEVQGFWGELRIRGSPLIKEVLDNVKGEKRKEVVVRATEEWNLLNRIDDAKSYVESFVAENRDKLEVSGDLNQYVRDIKFNVHEIIE